MSEIPIVTTSEFSTAELTGRDSRAILTVGSFAVRHNRVPYGHAGRDDTIKPDMALPHLDDRQPLSGKFPSPHIDQCRRLVARRYIQEGYVTEADLDSNGHLDQATDPYVRDSEYFWKAGKDGNVTATLRIIHSAAGDPLPIERSFNLFSRQRAELSRLREASPDSVVEISALAKTEEVESRASRAALDMYRAVWQHAKRTGIDLCAVSADARLHDMLTKTFGEAFEVAGEPTEMMGSLTVPSLLHPNRCAEALVRVYQQKLDGSNPTAALSYKRLIEYLKDGLDTRYLNAEEQAALNSVGLLYS